MEEHSAPTVRATIRAGRITLNAWTPWLITGGPARVHLDRALRAGIALADLTMLAPGEIGVEWVPEEAGTREAERVLLRWAAGIGHTRVWLPDRVEDLKPVPPEGRARVTCPTCASRFRDSGRRFWEGVRESGWFPGGCPGCGGSLPEWTVAPAPTPAPTAQQTLTTGSPAPPT